MGGMGGMGAGLGSARITFSSSEGAPRANAVGVVPDSKAPKKMRLIGVVSDATVGWRRSPRRSPTACSEKK